ncbi:hypothetical protein B0T24DRAFT_551399, partial [Lasiosphaeria ovina]
NKSHGNKTDWPPHQSEEHNKKTEKKESILRQPNSRSRHRSIFLWFCCSIISCERTKTSRLRSTPRPARYRSTRATAIGSCQGCPGHASPVPRAPAR